MNLRGLIDKMQQEITGITKFTGSNGKKFPGRDSIQRETTGKRKFTGCNLIQWEITNPWEKQNSQDAIQSNRKLQEKPNSWDVIQSNRKLQEKIQFIGCDSIQQ